MSNPQTAQSIIMMRPSHFSANSETASSNAFQSSVAIPKDISLKAIEEFNNMVEILRNNNIEVIVIDDDPQPPKPDTVFLNNWFSTHDSGLVIVYPLESQIRRQERRLDIFDTLERKYRCLYSEITNLSIMEHEGKYLEGTGSLVLDRRERVAYMCVSSRSNAHVLNMFCHKAGYRGVTFHAYDENDVPVYHTNVMMSVGDKFAIVCSESIKNDAERVQVVSSLEESSREIIEISHEQMRSFAGNALEVCNGDEENFLVISRRAFDSLDAQQIEKINKYAKPLPIAIPLIELHGGGSVRCMMAENFLPGIDEE
ncbi:citrulline utilization hydrolase CtlX [Candidatus Uabimicrobium amorphum]|uniref:Amidinotransferase n=1 Tax=Uabimicrobium amorphum TaxID=2596890 RepID=A0A5S9IJ54_UABAM|nr:arginine deiminase-related protein [Candidatus Uabimicrobium amorphum]BBM82849.1 hypothetical protein UABAM_01192 [Candidatus Uabimicrobium amorphum]